MSCRKSLNRFWMVCIFSISLILFAAGMASADEFDIGGTLVKIPSPEGYALVTEIMEKAYRLQMSISDPYNDTLAYYISNEEVPRALAGKLPKPGPHFRIKIDKRLRERKLTPAEFKRLRHATGNQLLKTHQAIKAKLKDHYRKAGKDIGDEFDLDFDMSLAQTVIFKPHLNESNMLAYSLYSVTDISTSGKKMQDVQSVTCTIVYVAEKVIYLYCFGLKDGLEFTRSASKSWADKILEENASPN